MFKKYLSTILFVLSALLTVAFAALLLRDYCVVYPYGSAPFYLYIIVRAVEFLLPAAISLTIAIVLKNKNR